MLVPSFPAFGHDTHSIPAGFKNFLAFTKSLWSARESVKKYGYSQKYQTVFWQTGWGLVQKVASPLAEYARKYLASLP